MEAWKAGRWRTPLGSTSRNWAILRSLRESYRSIRIWKLLNCARCGVLYASPAFVPEFLSDAYREASYDSGEEAQYAAETYAGELGSIVASLGDHEFALEVGAGNGAFLPHLQAAGFRKVVGIEPSELAVATAAPSVRPLIKLGMFQAGDFEPASVDLFSCFQTIEHVEDPRSLCSAAFELLRPNGAIFLVSHDYNSWVTRLIGEKSPIFDIEHLQLFCPGSLRFLLTACGYQDIRIGTIWNRYPLSYWIKLLPGPTGLKRSIIALSRKFLIGRMPVSLNIGNIYAVGFKRV